MYKSILEEAQGTVHNDRMVDYGHPLDHFEHTAKLWGAYKGVEFSAEDIGFMMILFKISRESHRPKRDNCLDIAGYAETVEWLKHEREVRKQ